MIWIEDIVGVIPAFTQTAEGMSAYDLWNRAPYAWQRYLCTLPVTTLEAYGDDMAALLDLARIAVDTPVVLRKVEG